MPKLDIKINAGPKVINGIAWSKKLDVTFEDNYKRDPSLSWQYFGSSSGFMRQYPAAKWPVDGKEADLYDCRLRDWYIKSATGPKDIVILMDTSGSMTAQRKEIAKHVVLNIMETLGEDDFVTVLKFSERTEPLVKCFRNNQGEPELVQATNENIAEFMKAVDDIKNGETANFTSALVTAFELLQKYRWDNSLGSSCNQAIMLVTDGVPYKFEEIFLVSSWAISTFFSMSLSISIEIKFMSLSSPLSFIILVIRMRQHNL